MEQTKLRVLLLALLLHLGGCVHAQEKEGQAFTPETKISDQRLSVPLMVEQIVSLKGPAKLSYVHGTCYIIRDDTGSQIAVAAVPLRNGDLLDLNEDCSVKIHQSRKSDITLRRENGRFFRFDIKQ